MGVYSASLFSAHECALIRMETADIFPIETEEEFLSFERGYTGSILHEYEQNSGSEEDDVKSDADELESLNASATVAISDPEAVKEQQHVNKFMSETCNCKLGPKLTPCSDMLSRETIVDQREKCFKLEKCELDMVVLGQLQAFSRNIHDDEPVRRHAYIEFLFRGRRVCRKTYVLVHFESKKIS